MTSTHLFKITALVGLAFGICVVARTVDIGEVFNPTRVVGELQAEGPLAPVLFILLMAMSVVISPIPS